MEQGDLGIVRHGNHDWPNPLGLSIEILDLELAQGLVDRDLVEATRPIYQDGTPAQDEAAAVMEEVGAQIAVRKARAVLISNGMDIADRPIRVAIVMALPESTKWAVLVPIVVLADQERPSGAP